MIEEPRKEIRRYEYELFEEKFEEDEFAFSYNFGFDRRNEYLD